MVFERATPSFSTQNVLTQYLRRIFTELLRQEENGFESDYVSFRLPFKSSLFALCLCALCLFALSQFALCLFALCLVALCIFALCIFALCLFALCLFALCLFALCLFALCLFALCLFALCLFALCPFALCLLPVSMAFYILTSCMIPETGFCPSASVGCIPDLEHRIGLLLFSFGLMHVQFG